MQQCIWCDKSLEQSVFIGKTGKSTKICFNYRQKCLEYYVEIDDHYPIESKEMKKKLYEQILEVRINKHIENKESSIKFLYKISVVMLGNTS